MIHFNLYWAQDPESYKSVTSYFTLIAYRVIFWVSYQWKTVAVIEQFRLQVCK